MKTYKIFQGTHFDDIHLRVEIGTYTCSESEATVFANQTLKTVLREDGLLIIFGDDYIIISNEEKEKYQFELCTKELPPPIDARNLSAEEQIALFYDERYMTTPEDYQEVEWDLFKAYKELKQIHSKKDNFSFSSLSYSLEESIG